MANRLQNSWQLVKASASVLASDKELVIFPILSALGTFIVTLTFLIPMFFAGVFDSLAIEGIDIAGILVAFAFYIVQYTVIFFANTALVGAAMIRLRGGDPTVGDGFRIAFSRFGPILGYALISATVGMILRAISEKSRGLGRFVISLIGMAWNVATFLVVPILAVEGVGPIEAIKRSAGLLKRTWGEQIAGNIGLGLVFGLITLGLILTGAALTAVGFIVVDAPWLGIAALVILVLGLVLIGLIQSTLNGIYSAAVYQYAATGETGGFFDPELVKHSFRDQQQ